MKTTLVLKKWLEAGETPPAKFYLTNTYGDYIFLHAASLEEAESWCKFHYPHNAVMSTLRGHKNAANQRPYNQLKDYV